MPQISIRGTDLSTAVKIAPKLREAVVSVTGTDAKYITTEFISSVQMDAAGVCASTPKVDVLWLTGRPQEMHDALAKEFTRLFEEGGNEKVQVTFTNMPPNYFYDNGVHY